MNEKTPAAMYAPSIDPDVLLNRLQVEKWLNVSRDAFQKIRRNQAAAFPKPVDIGSSVKRWRPRDIAAWLDIRAGQAAA
jgi:predicted DNA-binding transcriptional regulator AlpA